MDVIIDVQNTDVIHAVFTYGVRIDFKFHQTLHTHPTMISIEIHIFVRRISLSLKSSKVSIVWENLHKPSLIRLGKMIYQFL